MKRKTTYATYALTVLFMAFLLVAASPVTTSEDTSSYIKHQWIIYDEPNVVNFRFVRAGENTDPEYFFIGKLTFCNKLLDVRALSIYNPTDSSRVWASLIDRTLQQNDTCLVEMFVFGIHGGALRKQVEKDGLCTIAVHGSMDTASFMLTKFGEENLLRLILVVEEYSD